MHLGAVVDKHLEDRILEAYWRTFDFYTHRTRTNWWSVISCFLHVFFCISSNLLQETCSLIDAVDWIYNASQDGSDEISYSCVRKIALCHTSLKKALHVLASHSTTTIQPWRAPHVHIMLLCSCCGCMHTNSESQDWEPTMEDFWALSDTSSNSNLGDRWLHKWMAYRKP